VENNKHAGPGGTVNKRHKQGKGMERRPGTRQSPRGRRGRVGLYDAVGGGEARRGMDVSSKMLQRLVDGWGLTELTEGGAYMLVALLGPYAINALTTAQATCSLPHTD
jgi:hypothetical protein